MRMAVTVPQPWSCRVKFACIEPSAFKLMLPSP